MSNVKALSSDETKAMPNFKVQVMAKDRFYILALLYLDLIWHLNFDR
jgi:hypothetical protein